MNTHYQTLELSEQATPDDVRRAYRRLVLLTHPDRTPDPAAHARFLEISSAYQVLSDPRRRASYDALLWMLRNPPPPRPAADQRRRAAQVRRAVRPRARPLTNQEKYAAQYARLFRWLRPLMLLALLLSGSLAFDRLLVRDQPERIDDLQAGVYYTSGRYPEPHVYYVHTTPQGRFASDSAVAVGTVVQVRRTPLWHKALLVQPPRPRPVIRPDSVYSGLAWLVPLALGLLAGLTLWPRLNLDYRLAFGLCSFVLLGITLYQVLRL